MNDEEFEAAIDAILAGPSGDASHRAMDRLTNEVLSDLGGGFARGVAKWLAAIEGYHSAAVLGCSDIGD